MHSHDWGYVQANGLRMHYIRTGGDKPSLLLAHGFTDDGACWNPVAEQLRDEYDVVKLDARCHGMSAAPDDPYGPQDQAADMYGVIAGLGLGTPPVLGHSMGAATALALAALYPDAAGAILLEDPPPVWMDTPPAQADDIAKRARTSARIAEMQKKTREQLMADEHAAHPGWSTAELEPWADSKLRVCADISNRIDQLRVDWNQILPNITCPVLLITGETGNGCLVSPEQAAALCSILPQTQVAHIAGAGHSIRRDCFGAYIEAVRGFLARNRG